jgi:hypothetical protein
VRVELKLCRSGSASGISEDWECVLGGGKVEGGCTSWFLVEGGCTSWFLVEGGCTSWFLGTEQLL